MGKTGGNQHAENAASPEAGTSKLGRRQLGNQAVLVVGCFLALKPPRTADRALAGRLWANSQRTADTHRRTRQFRLVHVPLHWEEGGALFCPNRF